MYALAIPEKSISQDFQVDTRWLKYFDPRAAVAAVAAHVEALPSSRTPERHTHRVYSSGLAYFNEWMGMRLPTEDLMTGYIAHLVRKGLKSSTIASKYLAPARLYLGKLGNQRITGFTGEDRDYISDCRDHILSASRVQTPRMETTTNVAPLWRPDFVRLNLNQVNAVLRAIDRSTIAGLRDYALLLIAFSSGFRIAELQRITVGSIRRESDAVLITVRGKRSNVDPVPVSESAASAISAYVNAYNEGLELDDPRRITPSTPIWQPLLHGDNYAILGINNYRPDRGMSQMAIRNIIAERTARTLGDQFRIAAHDTRRTAAAIAYDAGMPLTDIQKLLRHKDAGVTLRYIGQKPDFKGATLENYVTLG